jgi:hypothetical protein
LRFQYDADGLNEGREAMFVIFVERLTVIAV